MRKFIVCGLILGLIACSRNEAGAPQAGTQQGGGPQMAGGTGIGNGLLANLENAVGVGIQVTDSAMSRILTNGSFGSVFNLEAKVYEIRDTANYIVAWGLFVTKAGARSGDWDCELIAIPKGTSVKQVRCLADYRKFDYSKTAVQGFTTTGSAVFFSYNGEKLELRKWQEDSINPAEAVFSVTPIDERPFKSILKPFVSIETDAICINTAGWSDARKLLCRSGGKDWQVVMNGVDDGTGRMSDTGLQVGEFVLSDVHVVDLRTLALSQTQAFYGTPRDRDLIVPVSFGAIYIDGLNRLVCADRSFGLRTVVNASISWRGLNRFGPQVWVWGDGSLRRIPSDKCELDPVNYVERTSLLTIDTFSISSDGTIQLRGTTKQGTTGLAFLDQNGNPVTRESEQPGLKNILFFARK